MDSVLYWIGALHAAIYTIAGTALAIWYFAEWLIDRLKIKRDLIRALSEYYKKRNAETFHGG